MPEIVASNMDEALADLAKKFLMEAPVERRASSVRELRGPATIRLADPRRRLCLNPARALNPWVSLAEFPWIMAGRADVEWLKPYLPRAGDFSDDGKVWRAGYGRRLRPQVGIDQIMYIATVLANDLNSRHAVSVIWDPAEEAPAQLTGTKDMPCTIALHFQFQHGALTLTTFMRSNDAIWGLTGVNVVNFTLLQELVAFSLRVPVGPYYHVGSNLHLYERHYGMAERLAEPYDELEAIVPTPIAPGPGLLLGDFLRECEWAVDEVQARRQNPDDWPSPADVRSHWLQQWSRFMLLHARIGTATRREWGRWLRTGADISVDWRLAALAHLYRIGEIGIAELYAGAPYDNDHGWARAVVARHEASLRAAGAAEAKV